MTRLEIVAKAVGYIFTAVMLWFVWHQAQWAVALAITLAVLAQESTSLTIRWVAQELIALKRAQVSAVVHNHLYGDEDR